MKTLPPVHRLNDSRPILEKIPSHPWENTVTFNPACALVTDRKEFDSIITALPLEERTKAILSEEPALCFLLYRAQGLKTPEHDHTRSTIGLAILTADLRPLVRLPKPVIVPEFPYEDLGVEDGRITRIGSRYVIVYCAYGSGEPENKIRIALASTADFVHWEKHGLLRGEFNTIDNKNGMIFEHRDPGKFFMLHRPMTGPDAMSVHWAEADDVFGEWTTRGLLLPSRKYDEFINTWTGGGAPPILLPDGRYLILYHIGNRKANGDKEYDLGIAIGDPSTKDFIVKRDEPLLRPSTPAEQTADPVLGVGNVVFICGAYFYKGDLYFPYAGADSVVLGGKIEKRDIEAYCNQV
jgi:beta-1,2-mannobiose phosphorylase / 1,2-beta-oligomannan phosphorylase